MKLLQVPEGKVTTYGDLAKAVGLENGQSTFTFPDGDKYVGEFRDGKFHGQGTFTFSDGNKGVGEFRYNKPWNITTYDKDGNYKWKYLKGVRR